MALFYYPLPSDYFNVSSSNSYHDAHTYSSHGKGKLDLSAPLGTPVYSMVGGTVLKAGPDNSDPSNISVDVMNTQDNFWTPGTSGYSLVVRHYHIDPSVSVGDTVVKGQQIGTVGYCDTGYHLHIDFCYGTSSNYQGQYMDGRYTNISDMPSNMQEKINMWASSYPPGGSDWGRSWEVFASEGMALSMSSGKETLITPTDFPFQTTYYRAKKDGVLQIPYYQTTSKQTLYSFMSSEALSAGVMGSVASKYIYDHYGYNYGSEGRTKVRIEALDGGSFNGAGYYYIDDSNATGITADGAHWIFDLYISDYTEQYHLSDIQEANGREINVYICE